MNNFPAKIINLVQLAGVIGAGGGGFPAHVKLQAKVDLVIANGSECEPLLASDCTMMEKYPERLVEGLKLAMQATHAKEGVIALKKHYHSAIAALQKVLPTNSAIRLHLLDNYYPAGDEFLTVYEVTGKVIPEGGIPLNVGVVVCNVTSLMQMYDAMHGKPVTERTVTLAGEFAKPQVVTVPIGTTYNDLLQLAGGVTSDNVVIVDGGPMMGKIITDLNQGIAKTTSGVLALPKEHFIVRAKIQTLSQTIKRSKSACCQCFRCTDLCPRGLLGHNISPHATMRSIDYNQAEPAANITSAFLCSQCGVCELIACDIMQLSPRKIFAAYRKELVSRGIKNPHTQSDIKTNSQFNHRKIGIPMLMKKLDLEKYAVNLPYTGLQKFSEVRIGLDTHIGAPALPLVKVGQQVKMGDVIASTPADQLGAMYHASISGKISDIDTKYITIAT